MWFTFFFREGGGSRVRGGKRREGGDKVKVSHPSHPLSLSAIVGGGERGEE